MLRYMVYSLFILGGINKKFKEDISMREVAQFDPVNFSMEQLNNLSPVRKQPEENYIYNGRLYSTFKCNVCGKEQMVLIDPNTHKPYGNPRCYDIRCSNYGYSRDVKDLDKRSKKVTDKVVAEAFGNYGQLILVGYLDKDNLLCVDSSDLSFIVMNSEVAGLFAN